MESRLPAVEALKAEDVSGPVADQHEVFSQEVPDGSLLLGIDISFRKDT